MNQDYLTKFRYANVLEIMMDGFIFKKIVNKSDFFLKNKIYFFERTKEKNVIEINIRLFP